jgi:hypothetical protein
MIWNLEHDLWIGKDLEWHAAVRNSHADLESNEDAPGIPWPRRVSYWEQTWDGQTETQTRQTVCEQDDAKDIWAWKRWTARIIYNGMLRLWTHLP